MQIASTTFEQPRMEIGRHARHAYRAMIAFDGAIELDSSLGDLVRVRASMLNGCAYCVDMHTKDARAAGETEQRLYSLATWHEAPFYTDRERAALALTDAITLIADSRVPREIYDDAARHFDEPELAQLIWTITAINAWNRIAVATRMLPGEYQAA
jgi:AhpD family alkylhydroperoxidase